ncbi:hypothetical protein LBMAG42_26870 [Deltaproteobacteria bacterium]|nr:hypothetical protein LBMAG42_26870 [Deltaproteobacteria bacterium]
MFAILGADLCAAGLVPIALGFTLVARSRNKWRGAAMAMAVVALMAALAPICAGIGGYMLGMSRVEAALELVDPDKRELIEKMGSEEAGQNLNFGFGTGCLCLVPALIALMLVPAKPVAHDDFA